MYTISHSKKKNIRNFDNLPKYALKINYCDQTGRQSDSLSIFAPKNSKEKIQYSLIIYFIYT